jgi:hypothetical protein
MKNKQSIKLNINRERPQNKTCGSGKFGNHIFLASGFHFISKIKWMLVDFGNSRYHI